MHFNYFFFVFIPTSISLLSSIYFFFCFLWLFGPFPCHDLPRFVHTRLVTANQFFLSSNLAASFLTSSSHLFISFPAGLLHPRLPSRIPFEITLSNIPAYWSILTRMHVTGTMSPCNLTLLHCTVFYRHHWLALVYNLFIFPQFLSPISLSLFSSFCIRSFLPRFLFPCFFPLLFLNSNS